MELVRFSFRSRLYCILWYCLKTLELCGTQVYIIYIYIEKYSSFVVVHAKGPTDEFFLHAS